MKPRQAGQRLVPASQIEIGDFNRIGRHRSLILEGNLNHAAISAYRRRKFDCVELGDRTSQASGSEYSVPLPLHRLPVNITLQGRAGERA
jgi:hypothetical protein